MKQMLVLMVLMVHNYLALYAVTKDKEHITDYADKGVWEIAGSGSFSINFYQDNRTYEIDLMPAVAFFVVNRIHFGLKNMFIYTVASSDISDKWHHFYDCASFISSGYVLKLRHKLYLDCMADYGLSITQSEARRYYVLISAIKYDLRRALLVMNLIYKYTDYDRESLIKDYFNLQLGIGFSVYL